VDLFLIARIISVGLCDEKMIESLGVVATILFCLATLAQTIKSYREGHSDGVSHGFIWMLSMGFTLMSIYVVNTTGWDWILLSSYWIQLLLFGIIIKYKYWRRN